ncbi:hypothetical protein Q5425_20245 [Amycolatopsis sp. A133]|nr:hypothetical protein [Amycolatopsis sp. A133]MDQ7806079.1 hypothetical protein [Amycolatopsis sp. A133]
MAEFTKCTTAVEPERRRGNNVNGAIELSSRNTVREPSKHAVSRA